MAQYNIIAETNLNTVVAEYEPMPHRADSYQSEAELEKLFISMLEEQGYEHPAIHGEEALLQNLREKIEKLNGYTFSDDEWKRFLSESVSKPNDAIEDKTYRIQEDSVQVLRRDDGSSKNIKLIDRETPQNNSLQVISQYAVKKESGAKHDNRYDVTVLVNGLPLVQVELKRRGVAIREAFNQISRYMEDSYSAGSALFHYVQIFVISNGTNTKYYSNSTRYNAIREHQGGRQGKTSNSFEFTNFWADTRNRTIPDLEDFTRTFFARHTLLNVLTRYCVFTSEKMLLVMRPYQITATEQILNKIATANSYKQYGTRDGGGYIWHTTGSGKTLTSFKTARMASHLPYIDKVLFVVDRKDLDYQTMKEYDRFEKGAANSNTNTAILKRQLEDGNARIIITTIQKFSTFIKKNPAHPVYQKRVVIIFDECHRSQFGDMHRAVTRNFKKYNLFGFTGTPIFAVNSVKSKGQYFTTEQTFGARLHSYTIVDAINDRNVLKFHVDYVKTMEAEPDIDDKQVWDINREQAYMAPERIRVVTKYILDHFDQKTYRQGKSYEYRKLQNVQEVVADRNAESKKQKVYVKGFNSIFCVSSVEAAKMYYLEFQKQIRENPGQRLVVATIYSYAPNPESENGLLDEENVGDASGLNQSDRDFLDMAIRDYNGQFKTNYSTDGENFESYYKDISLRMKNKEIDILIVVNMFLTGFDATTLNTLWVDKNLKMHGLIQAFSRTNRILNSVKTFGNIVCFRNLQKRVDDAIALFGDREAGGVVLLRKFEDYYNGFTDDEGRGHKGYAEMIESLRTKFPLAENAIEGEKRQKDFIVLFGSVLRMRNMLSSFDEFQGREILSEYEFQDYLSRYQDLKDEWGRQIAGGEKEDITEDIVFETELICQIEVNIDYILMLVQQYHDSTAGIRNCLSRSARRLIPVHSSGAKRRSSRLSLPA